jgi:hypothetical protein
MLDGCGKKIRLDFELRNANPESESSNGRTFAALTESLGSLKAENSVRKAELKAELNKVADCCGRLEACMAMLMAERTVETSDTSATPSNKRKVSLVDPSPAVASIFNRNTKPKLTVVSNDPGTSWPEHITKITP